jgi:PAS domain S-box-containing protein
MVLPVDKPGSAETPAPSRDVPVLAVGTGGSIPPPGFDHLEHTRMVLELAMRSSRMGAWQQEFATGAVWWSDSLEEIFGFEKGEFRGTVQAFYELMYEPDWDVARGEIEEAIANKRPFQYEFRFHHKDGSIRWMEARGQAVYTASGEPLQLHGVGIDITERKASEEQSRFFSELNQAVQQITDPSEVMKVTARMLGEHLGVDRCAYAEIDDEAIFVITGDYTNNVPSIVGNWPVAAFGKECVRQMAENEAYVVYDSDHDDRIGPDDLPAYQATNICAVICVPLHKDGKFSAAMAVHQKTPRTWTGAEVELVELVVNRCWESLERARAERAIRESDERFRSLMEQAPMSVQLFEPGGRHIQVNRAWEELWGIRFEDIPEYNILQDPQLEDRGIADDIRRVFAGEAVELRAIEYDPNITVPGATTYEDPTRWVSAIAYPLKGPDGEVREVALVHQDITDRRKAELELVFQKTLLEALTESVLDGILIVSSKGKMLQANRRFTEIWNFPEEILESRSDAAALKWAADQTTDPAAFLARVEAIYQQPDQQAREEVRMKDGRVFERFGAPIYDNDTRLGWVWTFRDISERKQAEEKLLESENNLRSLANTIPQLAWMAEPDGHVFWYNEGWYAYTGTTSEQMTGWGWQSVHDPQMLADVVDQWKRSIETGEPFEMEFPLRGADGQFRWFLTRVNPLKDPQNKIVRWFGTNTDITRIREIERGLQQARTQLETRVMERTKELAATNEMLLRQMSERARAEEERTQLLKRLVSVQEDERGRISRDIHDHLGQRVTALRLKTASLKDLFTENEQVRSRVDQLQEIAEQLDHEVSFVSWELRPSILDDLEFADALENYVAEWSRHSGILAEFSSIGSKQAFLDHDVKINLYRITQEALNNAAKYSMANQVNVLLDWRSDHLLLIVEDDGKGFDVSSISAGRESRKGFGLVGMRERASLLGGHIEIESDVDKGTAIYIHIPLSHE